MPKQHEREKIIRVSSHLVLILEKYTLQKLLFLYQYFLSQYKHVIPDDYIAEFAEQTNGYTGADLKQLAKNALHISSERIHTATRFMKVTQTITQNQYFFLNNKYTFQFQCDGRDGYAISRCVGQCNYCFEATIEDFSSIPQQTICINDFRQALKELPKTVTNVIKMKNEKFTREFGFK